MRRLYQTQDWCIFYTQGMLLRVVKNRKQTSTQPLCSQCPGGKWWCAIPGGHKPKLLRARVGWHVISILLSLPLCTLTPTPSTRLFLWTFQSVLQALPPKEQLPRQGKLNAQPELVRLWQSNCFEILTESHSTRWSVISRKVDCCKKTKQQNSRTPVFSVCKLYD